MIVEYMWQEVLFFLGVNVFIAAAVLLSLSTWAF